MPITPATQQPARTVKVLREPYGPGLDQYLYVDERGAVVGMAVFVEELRPAVDGAASLAAGEIARGLTGIAAKQIGTAIRRHLRVVRGGASG